MTYEWELHQPGQKEGQKLFGCHIGARWQGISEILPGATKDATKHYRKEIASVKCLNTVPDNAYHSTDKDEEVGPVHAHNGAREDGTM